MKTVASVVKSLEKIASKLDAVADANFKRGGHIKDEIQDLNVELMNCDTEAATADRIATNIRKLIT